MQTTIIYKETGNRIIKSAIEHNQHGWTRIVGISKIKQKKREDIYTYLEIPRIA